jgi:TPR repeat protein
MLILVTPALAVADTPPFSSAREALKQGVSAYQGGYYEIAIPALEYAADHSEFLGTYYLARIYSDNTGAYTDHAKAYQLYERIVDEHIDADPDDDPRAPYVGKALTALAGYVRRGLPEIGLKADPERAVFYLKNASTTFNDEDAQYELAKLQLKGEGIETNVPLGRHWLSILSQNGHAGAQAFFADLLWRGKHVEADPPRALALISIAVENAPPQERLWIEDIYQNIFCGSGEGIRTQATGLVAQWGDRYGRKPTDSRDRTGLGPLAAGPIRTCQNGESVSPISDRRSEVAAGTSAAAEKPVAAPMPRVPEVRGFAYGAASGPSNLGGPKGLRQVDTPIPAGPAPR